MDPPIVRIDGELCPELELLLDERLYEYSARATGIDDGRMLTARVHDASGALIAGLSGYTWGGSSEITRLWVHESRRREGLGSRLMLAAEAEARRRGCARIALLTYSFQAPAFYEALGYRRVASLSDYPQGHSRHWYEKRLV